MYKLVDTIVSSDNSKIFVINNGTKDVYYTEDDINTLISSGIAVDGYVPSNHIYHGTPNLIVDPIQPKSEKFNDFGSGFYTAKELPIAESMAIKNNTNGFVYTYAYSLDNLNVYTFNDIEFWMLFVLHNRGGIDKGKYRKLDAMVERVLSYDVVIGLISDDRSAHIYNQFRLGAITDKCVEECLAYYQLGEQIVFKTERACKVLHEVKLHENTTEDFNRIRHDKSVRIGTAQNVVEKLKVKYENTGTRINTLLEKYR